MSHQFGVHDTCGMIGGLHVHREYQFSISATVVDVDGSVSESVRSTFIPIFVPGLSKLVQIWCSQVLLFYTHLNPQQQIWD